MRKLFLQTYGWLLEWRLRPVVPAESDTATQEKKLQLPLRISWIFRVSVFCCFMGHGVFGVLTKDEWLPFFSVFHIGSDAAYRLMPLIGAMDIGLALWALYHPCRAVLLWMTFWGFWTALLRPLAGQGLWEFLERAGNYGIPLAFLAFSGWMDQSKGWLKKNLVQELTSTHVERIIWILRFTTGLLLIGHGGFGAFMQKGQLIHHYAAIGIQMGKPALAFVGWFEIVMGAFVIVRPWRPLLMFIVVWKVFSELLYPMSGAPIWEFIERFGSYCAPVALLLLLNSKQERVRVGNLADSV